MQVRKSGFQSEGAQKGATMYPSHFAHLKNEYELPVSDSVAPGRHSSRSPRRLRVVRPALALTTRSARPRTATHTYEACE